MEEIAVSPQISLKNILYATDFSRYSDAALPFALSLGSKYHSTIFSAHIISLSPFPKSSPTHTLQAIAAQALREAQQSMRRLEPQWQQFPHETLIRKGKIWTELSAIVTEKKIDLIVTGTHGRTGASKMLVGSVAENILRHSPVPVLTVGPRAVGEPQGIAEIHTILFPTDFTTESLAAVPYAVSLARENQARLYLMHVAEEPFSPLAKKELTQRLYDLIPPDAGLSCAPKALIEYGSPADVIVGFTEELTMDLIVLGPRRHPRVPGSTHLPASTATTILSRAICPVLTVCAAGAEN